MSIENLKPVCWCGNKELSPFSNEYLFCENCKTLVLRKWPEQKTFTVKQDEQDFYGKSYWFEHQEKDLQFGNIVTRARTDLSERILHWLNTLLKYKLPPASTLELGCSHGGFVGVLQWAGFQASGLEMSPWVVDFARQTFQVPMYQGRLEDQKIEPGSLDAIALMDVLEHLPDPVASMSAAASLLKKDGILIIQTPCYPEGCSFEYLKKENHPFLMQFKASEHLYLFSQSSIQPFLNTCGLPYVQFEPAFFGMYDMFVVASATPLQTNTKEAIDQALIHAPGGRLVLALLDKDVQYRELSGRLQESETDRAARLEQIHQYDAWLKEARTELKQLKNSFLYRFGRKLGII